MSKIYPNVDEREFNEKEIKTVVVYVDKDDGNVFYDEAKTVKIPKDELLNLCLKGFLTILFNGEYLKPISFKDNTTDAVVVVSNDTANYCFYSAEHVAG